MRLSLILVLFLPLLLSAGDPQATIIDTGSTNRAGLRVTFDEGGRATVELRGAQMQRIKLNERLCSQFLQTLKSTGRLSDLPARHCMKSASFGSSLYVEFNGERSPDLDCSGQLDPRADSLQKSAREILKAAQETAGIRPGRIITAPYPPR